MAILSSELVWIVVSDFPKARKFFTQVLGLKELSCSEEFGWAELAGKEGGSYIGLARDDKESPIRAGNNAVITFTVDNLVETKKELQKKGVSFIGDIMEVPGHVKLQLLKDEDGNFFQLAEMLDLSKK